MGRTRLVALAALVAALAAGCGGAPTAKFVPPSSSSAPSDPTTTSAADVTPPVMPDLAKQHTVAGAKAFVGALVASVNYAYATLDSKPLAALMSDYCSGCRGGVHAIEKLAKRRATVAGGTWTISHIGVVRLRSGDQRPMRVLLVTTSDREVVTYPNGDRDIFPGGESSDQLMLSPEGNGWLVASWDTVG